ncbi:insulinase family protein [Thiohalocapsa marina]|uniref:Insulinase family protein n=1 Tax=Thiohalocapsa marina TaxID=424902 RepID=A0A5M8FL86_9GAMM|nr:insulinase family protein [Thiohalocapsa marina]
MARRAAAALGALMLLLPTLASAVPQIETWRTDNGAEVLFVAAPDLPMLDLRVVFDAGSARDGDRHGLASLTAGMLTEGAAGLSADTIAEGIESVGAELGSGADRDMAWVSLRTLTDPEALERALDLLTKVLTAPDFPAEDFERVQQNTLVALRLAEQDPKTVGSKALYRMVFGDHPYADDPSGTAETVSALRPAHLRDFHRHHYTAANATLALVGDLTREQAEVVAELVSLGLPAGERPADLPPVAALSQGQLQRIDFPSSQTHVYLGQPGMRRGDPDYFPLYVGNHILGGSGLVSQLMDEVREKRGLSYSAYSYFLPLSQNGPMVMGLQTRNEQAEEARSVMLETLQRFVASGPTADELDAALKNITGGFPLRIASNRSVVRYLAVIGFYDLPLDYLERFNERVSSVTAEQIRDAYRRRIHPDRLATVLVGGEQDSRSQTVNNGASAPAEAAPPSVAGGDATATATPASAGAPMQVPIQAPVRALIRAAGGEG